MHLSTSYQLCFLQKAEAKRAVRSRRRETARWLNSVTKGEYNMGFAVAADKKVLSSTLQLAQCTTTRRLSRLLVRLQGQPAGQRRRQGTAEAYAEQLEAERALWSFVFSGRPSAESMRESKRGARTHLSARCN